MAVIMVEGFDKYGPANSNSTSVTALMVGEWTTITAVNIAAPLSATGQAVTNGGAMTLTKTITAVGRIIGGVRFSSVLTQNIGVQFLDGASSQCGIQIAVTGIINLRNGFYTTGTILGSSASAISANTTHYLEWDITLGNSASYNVYLDGVSIISGTGDTTATANNTISGVSLQVAAGTNLATFDDFYLFDSTGSTNNAPLLTSPRIETTAPLSDSAVQFAIGASVLGGTVARTTTNFSTAANQFYVRPFTPSRACTINSISISVNATSATVNLRPVVYSDSSGVPGSLLSGGSTVTGITAATIATLPLTTPQSLTAGTQYWLGYMADIAVTNAFQAYDASAVGRTATSTFSSGAPGTAPSTTAGQTTVLLWGNVTLASAANFYEVSQSPPPAADTSYVADGTVSDEDLYNFANLSAVPASIYAVAVKAFCKRSDSGARTVSLRMKSSTTDGGGSSTGQTPATSYAWIGSNFETDPNGSIPWTGVNLNAATTGIKIDA
jgi:hypothetical protein